MFNIVTAKKTLFQETSTWAARVVSAGGGFEPNSVAIANNLVRQVKNASFGGKMVYLLPMLGRGIGAARVPLIDTLNVGTATNTAFVDADFSQATGLQGNGTSKYLDSLIRPSQLGVTNNGGIGFVTNSLSVAGDTVPIGCYGNVEGGDNRYVLDIRTSGAFRFYCWGSVANRTTDSTPGANGNYYGQRSSTTSRTLYFNGAAVNTNSASDSSTGASDRTMYILGSQQSNNTPRFNASRCTCSYMTDGTLSATEISDLNSLITNYLLSPTSKT